MSKPRMLDLFCSQGGAAMGYHQAGFEVVGVDIVAQPKYPFDFVLSDALVYLDTQDVSSFDVIHASPECKAYTNCNLSPKANYKKLIAEVRTRLERIGKPYIIENVVGAKKDLRATLMLCGSMFDLPMQRHRLFESNMFLYPPRQCNHENTPIGVYGHSIWDSSKEGTPRKDGKKRPDSVSISVGRAAMEIDWMNMEGLAEAIPPAMTRHIGLQLIEAIRNAECEVA